jgi:hypothetical protein
MTSREDGRPAAGGISMPSVLKPKRRGRGVGRAPFDVGKGGGMSGALFPLPPSTGGRPMVTVHGVAAPADDDGSGDRDVGDDPGTGHTGLTSGNSKEKLSRAAKAIGPN